MDERRATPTAGRLCTWEIVQYGIELAVVQGVPHSAQYMAEQGVDDRVIARVLNEPQNRRGQHGNADGSSLSNCAWMMFSHWQARLARSPSSLSKHAK